MNVTEPIIQAALLGTANREFVDVYKRQDRTHLNKLNAASWNKIGILHL